MNKKIAIVVGGSGGIGSEIVKSLINKGAYVCGTYSNNKDNIIKNIDGGVAKEYLSIYEMDLFNEGSVNNTFSQILKEKKAIDIIVFSATVKIDNKSLLNIEWDDFKEHIDLQTRGLVYIIKNLREQIKNKYKTKFIIILTEYCIGKPPTGISHYITAKYSLMGLAKSMAVELAKYNCTVNMISPGIVKTGLTSNLPQKIIDIYTEDNPLKRLATPKDVADVVLFLSSEEANYLNGVNIIVNGGEVML